MLRVSVHRQNPLASILGDRGGQNLDFRVGIDSGSEASGDFGTIELNSESIRQASAADCDIQELSPTKE